MIRKITLGFMLALATGIATAAGMVNINTAPAATLATELDGVGEARARAIVEYRESNGGFPSVASLTNVSGIGEATLAKNRDRLTVGSSEQE